jgi:hypothetical protein
VGGNSRRFVDGAEDRAIGNLRPIHPGSHSSGNPVWDGDGTHIATLADEIRDYPMFFSLLQILDTECGHLRATQPAPQQHRHHSVISDSLQSIPVENAE